MIPCLAVGDTVKLTGQPKGLSHCRGKVGHVVKVTPTPSIVLIAAELVMDSETGATTYVKDIPQAFFSKATPGEKTRRPRLTLREPRDDRSEAQKEQEAESFIRSFGYEVLHVGKFRKTSVCHECKKPVFCPIHHKPLFSPDTGSTPGVADWIVRHPVRWLQNTCLCIEWKKDEKAERKPEQILLSAAGWYPFVWSLPMLCHEIVSFERSVLGIEPLPEILTKGVFASK